MKADQIKRMCMAMMPLVSKKDVVLKTLKGADLDFTDDSEEYGYPNIHIPAEDGTLRIFKGSGDRFFRFQTWKKEEYKYSGIPVFEPSGRRSI